MQDITASGLPNADGFLRRSVLRVLAWVQAGLAYLHYGYLDWISRQSTPFTATDEYLEGWAALAPTPVLRKAPTPACGSATWAGVALTPLPVGTLCSRSDLSQFVTTAAAVVGSGGTVTTTIQAVVAGSASNTDAGAPLTLSGVVAGIVSLGAAAGPLTGGADLETDAALRTRMLESYAAPPHGGDQADYVTWALAVPGVTRAWCSPTGFGAGTVIVYFMMDVAEAVYGGFPQGSSGVAAAETRAVAATGDQLAVANYIFPLRPVTALVYAVAPQPQLQNFTLSGLTAISTAQRSQIASALASLFVTIDSPLGAASVQQSDCEAAMAAIGGLPSFSIVLPASWPLASPIGYVFILGTITYV
jgi:uncharacterized phage protein gp47/JayE